MEEGADDALESVDVLRVALEQVKTTTLQLNKAFKTVGNGDNLSKVGNRAQQLQEKLDNATQSADKFTAQLKNTDGTAEKLGGTLKQVKAPNFEKGGGLKSLKRAAEEANEVVSELDQELQKLRENQAFNKQLLASKEYRRELKQLAKQQRELDRIQEGSGEKFQRFLEIGENLTGTIDLLTTAKDAAVGLFSVLNKGANLRDLNQSLSNIGISGPNVGGLLTRGQSQRAGAVGFRLGLSQQQISGSGEIARAASLRGQAEGLGTRRELAQQFSVQAQEEIASGQVGQVLELAGLSQKQFEAEILKTEAALGLAVGGLDEFRKRQVLLTLALEESAKTSKIFSDQVSSSFDTLLAKGEGFFERQVEDISTDILQLFSQGYADDSLVGELVDSLSSPSVASTVANSLKKDELEEGQATANAQQVSQGILNEAGSQSALLSGGADFVENQILALEALREQVKLIEEGKSDEKERSVIISDILDGTRGLSNEQRTRFKNLQSEEAVQSIITKLRSEQLALQKNDLQTAIAKNTKELETNDTLTIQERTALKLSNVDADRLLQIANQVATYKEFFDLSTRDSALRDRTINIEEARVSELEKQVQFLSEAEREQVKNARAAIDLVKSAREITSNIDDQNTALSRGVAEKVFRNLSIEAGNITEQLGLGRINLTALTGAGGRFLNILNEISGSQILTLSNIASLIGGNATVKKAPTQKNQRRGGRSKQNNQAFLDNLEFEASLTPFGDQQQQRMRAAKEFEANVKQSQGSIRGLNASLTIYNAKIRDINEQNERGIFPTELAAQFGTAIRQGADFIGEQVRQAETVRDRLREVNNELLERGINNADGRTAAVLRIEQLKNERDAEIEQLKLTGEARLQVESLYEMRIQEIQESFHQQELERIRGRAEEITALSSSLYAKQTTDVIGVQQELEESLRARFEGTLNDGQTVESFDALSRTQQDLIMGSDVFIGAMEASAATVAAFADSSQSTAQSVGASINAIGKVTGGLIGNVKTRAGILGAFELAKAAAAVADFNFIKAGLHTAASIKFFALAGKGGGSGTVSSAKETRAQRTRTQLDSQDVSGGLRNREQRPQIIINNIINPVTGRVISDALNETGRKNPGVVLNTNLIADKPVLHGL